MLADQLTRQTDNSPSKQFFPNFHGKYAKKKKKKKKIKEQQFVARIPQNAWPQEATENSENFKVSRASLGR